MVGVAAAVPVEPFVPKENVKIETGGRWVFQLFCLGAVGLGVAVFLWAAGRCLMELPNVTNKPISPRLALPRPPPADPKAQATAMDMGAHEDAVGWGWGCL